MSLGFFGFVYQFLNIIHMIANEQFPDSPYKRLISKHSIFVIAGAFVAIHSYFHWPYVILFIIPFILLLIDLIQPLFHNTKEYSRSLEDWLNVREPEGLIPEYASKNNKSIVVVIIFALYFLPVLGSVGYGSALRKEEFPVVGDYAILKVYGYQGIAAKYDKDSNEILSEYKLINLNGSEFKVAHLGQLRKADH